MALRGLLVGIIPVSVLILATLETILLGLATPTDAAAVGAFGAFALTVAYRRLRWAMFRDAALRTLVAVNLQTAWLSPPVALSAYFLKGVVPRWELKDIYAGMMQFMVLQVVGLALILLVPALALRLPARLFP